jgi:hypothetical protein
MLNTDDGGALGMPPWRTAVALAGIAEEELAGG